MPTLTETRWSLKVLIYKIANAYVAECLETGSVATSEGPETAREIIRELLEDQVRQAVKKHAVRELFSSQAPTDIWERWFAPINASDIRLCLDLSHIIPAS